MAKRSGPVGRVRNRRNVDISGVPKPYPQMIILSFMSYTAGPVYSSVNIARKTWNGSSFDPYYTEECQLPPVGGFILNDTLESLENVQPAGPQDFFVITFFAVVQPGDKITLPPWFTSMRGPNGEWFAPTEIFVS